MECPKFVWKVRSIQFGAWGPSPSIQFVQFSSCSSDYELFQPRPGLTWLVRFGSGSVQFIESPFVWEEQKSSSRSPSAEIPAQRAPARGTSPGWMAGALCWLCLLACVRGAVWCRSDANLVQNRLKKFFKFSSPAQSFSSVLGTGAKCLRSVHSVQFNNSSGPKHKERRKQKCTQAAGSCFGA